MTKRLAIAFLTKDRVDLSERSIEPLIHDDIDLWIMDGSKTEKGRAFANDGCEDIAHVRANVTGGADAAIVYALTTLLNETDSPYVGITENDVLLHRDWCGPTLALFERGRAEGLDVGASSARCYEDRILVQRDGYALCHNLGAGNIIFTREAARIILSHYRSHWTTQGRKVFHQLCGLDIAKWWAFRGNQQFITVDWGFNTILAAHGRASLALTPSCCEMIGQAPPLADQGLTLVTEPVELLRVTPAFELFCERSAAIRGGTLRLPDQTFVSLDDGSQIIFPHQIGALHGNWYGLGEWRSKWQQGFGPFAYVAVGTQYDLPAAGGGTISMTGGSAYIEVPIAGPCAFLVGGGKTGGRVRLVDMQSGYEVEPELPPEGDAQQITQLVVPGNVAYRTIRLTALTPGVVFYGIKVHEAQPVDPTWTFDHSVLPKP